MGTIIDNIVVTFIDEKNTWVVNFTQDGIPQQSQEFTTEEDAILFELNLKFI
jgi:hypothetical protein